MPLSTASSRRLRGLSLLTLLAAGLATSGPASAALLRSLPVPAPGGTAAGTAETGYHGQVLLVVNTASKCGYTPQYEGLEALQKQYAGKGFAVLGFPSNDFKGQEPGDEKQIQDFCTLTYGVKFPMFEKVHVTGAQATPLYQRLTAATGVAPAWNFHKYLVGRDGTVIAQFASKVTPDDPQLKAAIDKALAAPAAH